jgi:uncharacterized membrane protein (DUF4010 family)
MDESFIIQTDTIQLTQMDFFIRMLVAAGIGFVIGIEREYSSIGKKYERFAGVRTFVVVVFLGFLTAMVSILFTPLLFMGVLICLGLIVSVSYWITANKGGIGGTTEFTILLAFLLGSTTFMGFIETSLALMVVTTVFLSLKVTIKTFIGEITQDELYAFITFVVLALLILPFLPNQTYGPFEVFNPKELGWVIVLTSGLTFVGHLLMKFLGTDRGILFTGIVGGLISSTVVTWVFSKKSKEVPELSIHCAVAILAASTIMIVRVVVWVLIFNPALWPALGLPIAVLFLAGLGISIYFYRKQQAANQLNAEVPLGNPLNLREAIFFGLLYTGILFLVSYANEEFGEAGIFLSTGIAALTDIDAITISLSKLAGKNIQFLTAQNAILIAALCNTIVKIGISLFAGSNRLRKYILIGYGVIFLAGIVGFIVLNA